MADFKEYQGMNASEFLVHYGVGHDKGGHSGRYPWGSGDRPKQRDGSSNNSLTVNSKVGQINEVIASDKYFKKRTTVLNGNKFSTDENNNVLYVTGLSGSGKSSFAVQMGEKGNNTIHMDVYFEPGNEEEDLKWQDPEFNSYLKKRGIPYEKIKSQNTDRQERWKIIDQFTDALEDFSKEQYKKGKGVVCEGVQIADEIAWPDKNYFKGKPMVIMTTSRIRSLMNGMERDEISPFDLLTIAYRLKWQNGWLKSINQLKKTV